MKKHSSFNWQKTASAGSILKKLALAGLLGGAIGGGGLAGYYGTGKYFENLGNYVRNSIENRIPRWMNQVEQIYELENGTSA